MTGDLLDQLLVRSQRMIGRNVAGEFILVPIVNRSADASVIYSLNGVGVFIWERLDGRQSGHDLVAAIVDTFEVTIDQARADYQAFVTQLTSVGALEAPESD
jgi:hypothetical protein